MQLIKIRKDFYQATRQKVEQLIGSDSKELSRYRQVYEKELSQFKWTSIDKKHLFARLKKAEIVLVGDFHAQNQSTRGFLRIIRKMKAPLCLALECLSADDQAYIDSYMAGDISEKDFLSKVSWKKNWGFPWENYRPLFKWAQQNKIKVFGVNARKKTEQKTSTLHHRDVASADLICKIKKNNPSSILFVQYGDFHIASAHLPKQIKKILPKISLCSIYQSPEIIYFKTMESHQELSTDIVRLDEDKWALNVLPPWVKWQDYLLFLESGFDRKVKIKDLDPTDSVSNAVELLAKSFGLKVDMSSLSVYSAQDDVFFEKVDRLPLNLKKIILEKVQEGQSFYIPELEISYLSRFSVNHVTKIAAQYLYFKEKGFLNTIIDPKKEFLKLIWLEAVTYLCTKVTNPKRKTDTLKDIRDALQKEQFDDRGKEALMLALAQKLQELQFVSQNKISNQLIKQSYSKKSYLIASQILGGILGEKFFYALIKKMIRFPLNKSLLFKNLSLSQFDKIYYESLEMVDSWPLLFQSKYDKM